MSHAKKHGGGEEEGGGHSVGLWYVSFADMITLLLTFFVMLTTFSSYSKEKLEQFKGAWAYMANYSIFPGRNITQDSVAPQEKHIDWSDQGSEKRPDDHSLDPSRNNKPSEWEPNSDGAYHDERSFFVHSSRLFWGDGASMTPAGKKHLDLVGRFLRQVPCEVVVGESNPPAAGDVSGRAFDRSWAIIDYLVTAWGIERDRFSIAPLDDAVCGQIANQPLVQVSLRARSIAE